MAESPLQQPAVSQPDFIASTASRKDLERGEDVELHPITKQVVESFKSTRAAASHGLFLRRNTFRSTVLDKTKLLSQHTWKKLLEDKSSLWVFEYRKESRGQYRWTQVYEKSVTAPTDVPEIPFIPDAAIDPRNGQRQPYFRLVLVEGLSPSVVASLSSAPLNIPDDFFRHHLEEEPDSRIRLQVEECFFVKWRRLGTQSYQQWQIDERIEDGKPYDINTGYDPRDLQLSHARYDRSPKAYRRCDLLDPCGRPPVPPSKQSTSEISLRISVQESISAFYKKTASGRTAVFVFDPLRQHKITPKNYKRFSKSKDGNEEICPSFQNLTACVEQLKKALNADANHDSSLEDVQKNIENIILRQVLRDQMQILRQINQSLDIIDMKMVDESALQLYISDWRVLFARLRTGLLASSESIASICRYLNTSRDSVAQESEVSLVKHDSVSLNRFKELLEDISEIRKRQESTFQALMSTMGILESQRGIKEAKAVTKLTNLAFFFIPLTYVAGICGMNVPAFAAGSLKLWMFAACSVCLLLATYLVLYAQDLLNISRNLSSYLTRTKITVESIRTLLKVHYWAKAILRFTGACVIPVLLFTSTIAIPIWAVVTYSTLSEPAKIAVGYLVGNCSLALCFLLAGVFWDQTKVDILLMLGILMSLMAMAAAIGLTIWAICTQTSLSDGQKAGASIGAVFGFPFTFLLPMIAAGVSSD